MSETARTFRGMGTMALGGVAAAGIGWLTLLAVARLRGPAEYADFSVVWSVYFVVAGVLIGLQQETTRSLVSSHFEVRQASLTRAGALATGTFLAVVILVVALTVVAGQGRALVEIGGPAILAIPLLGAAMVLNGALAAEEKWRLLAGLSLGDQAVRCIAVCAAVFLAPGPVAYGTALVAGLSCYVAPLVTTLRRKPVIPGTVAGFVRRSSAAMVSAGCANVLVVGLPALIIVTGGGPDQGLGVLFAAILLTRTPVLLVANSVRPVVVRLFVAKGHELWAYTVRLCPFVIVGTLVSAAVGAALGPLTLRLLFGPDYRASALLMAGLVTAAILILLLTWTGVALAAVNRDTESTLGWLLSLAVVVGCLVLPGDLERRTLTALLTGPGTGIIFHMCVLWRTSVDR